MSHVLEGMHPSSPLFKALSASGQEQAIKAARLLNAAIQAQSESNPGPKLYGCNQCKARLENPHADYHLTALIDPSKI